MYRFFFSLLAISCAAAAAAQPSTQLRDSRSGAPVPWATIKVLHRAKGAVADEGGRFSLQMEPGDTALVSSVGFAAKRVTALPDVLLLDPVARTLDTVRVRPTVPLRTVLLGNGVPFLNQRVGCDYPGAAAGPDCYPWGGGKADEGKTEFCERIKLPDSAKPYRLQRLWLPTRKQACYGALLLRVYLEDPLTGMPGEEIFVKRIDIDKSSVHRNQMKIVADLTPDNLLLPPGRAFFLSTGWPPDTESSCHASILLLKGSEVNTWSRTIVNRSYEWFPMRAPFENTGRPVHTIYAAELEERAYK